jgi:hypothetical protein
MANTVMNPQPQLREIVLLDDWNVPTPREELWSEEGDKCKTCGWDGKAEHILEHSLKNYIVNDPAASIRRSAEDGCVSCQILEAVVSALGFTSRLVHIYDGSRAPSITYRVKKGTASLSVDIFIQE